MYAPGAGGKKMDFLFAYNAAETGTQGGGVSA